jgi:hypothetical protein
MSTRRRFPDCQSYQQCLFHVVFYKRGLDCRGCQDYVPVKQEYSAQDKAGFQALLKAIFGKRKCNAESTISRIPAVEVSHGRTEPKTRRRYVSAYDKAL